MVTRTDCPESGRMHRFLAVLARAMCKLAAWLEPTPETYQFAESSLLFGDWLRQG